MKEINEAILGRKVYHNPAKEMMGRDVCILYDGNYYENVRITKILGNTKVEVYIPQLDKKVVTHYSMLDEDVSLLSTLRYMQAKHHEKKADKENAKFIKTRKASHLRKALDHADKAEDAKLLATASTKAEKEYVKKRRAEIDDNRLKDYLRHGVGKGYYEEED